MAPALSRLTVAPLRRWQRGHIRQCRRVVGWIRVLPDIFLAKRL